MSNKKQLLGFFGAAVLGGAVAFGGFKMLDNSVPTVYQSVQQPAPVQLSNYNTVVPPGLDFTFAAEKTTPAVVHIKTYVQVQPNQYQLRGNPYEDLLRHFFGDPYGYQQPQRQPQTQEPEEKRAGSGSGVILSADGYIVTNNHVVKDADKIEIVLNDKRTFVAELIGTDPSTDLAVLKVDSEGLPFVDIADSDKIKIGEWVVAVGNPFDLTSTVTAGIVSAKARNINILRAKDNLAIESFIQTDAAVNPGNSGGALVNASGELIGINTAIASPNGAFAGYAFAVPSILVDKVFKDIVEFGEVQRGLIGVSIADITSQMAAEKGLESYEGVYIAGVSEDGAAKEAGLKEGDVVLAVDGKKVNTTSELQELVGRHRPGESVKISFKRNGNIDDATMVLRNKLGNTDLVSKDEPIEILGAELKVASQEKLKRLRLDHGVEVTDIRDGKFKGAQIRKGLIITHVDKNKVESPQEVASIINNNSSDGVLIEGYMPDGSRHFYGFGR